MEVLAFDGRFIVVEVSFGAFGVAGTESSSGGTLGKERVVAEG